MFQFPEPGKLLGYLLTPASLAADNTPAALSIERYECVDVLVGVGVGGITFDATNKVEFKLRDGDATVGNHVAVDAEDVKLEPGDTLGSAGIIRSLVAAHAAGSLKRIAYIGGATHLSLLADFSGTHGSPTPMWVACIGRRGALTPPL